MAAMSDANKVSLAALFQPYGSETGVASDAVRLRLFSKIITTLEGTGWVFATPDVGNVALSGTNRLLLGGWVASIAQQEGYAGLTNTWLLDSLGWVDACQTATWGFTAP